MDNLTHIGQSRENVIFVSLVRARARQLQGDSNKAKVSAEQANVGCMI